MSDIEVVTLPTTIIQYAVVEAPAATPAVLSLGFADGEEQNIPVISVLLGVRDIHTGVEGPIALVLDLATFDELLSALEEAVDNLPVNNINDTYADVAPTISEEN